jgi:hypothetical protein
MAECLTVDQDVVGSTPISHPKKRSSRLGAFLIMEENQDVVPQGDDMGSTPISHPKNEAPEWELY